MILSKVKKVNKIRNEYACDVNWDDFDEEFYKAEEDFYAHKYNFAENVVSSLQQKIDGIAFEFGLGVSINASIDRIFDSEDNRRSDEKPYPEHVDKYNSRYNASNNSHQSIIQCPGWHYKIHFYPFITASGTCFVTFFPIPDKTTLSITSSMSRAFLRAGSSSMA